MEGFSIRLRLAVWYSAVLLVGLALFGSATWVTLRHRLIAGVDGRLMLQAEGLRAALDDEGVAANRRQIQEEVNEAAMQNESGASIQLRMENGEIVSSPAALPGFRLEEAPAEPAFSTIHAGGRPFRSLARLIQCRTARFDVLIVVPLDDVGAIMRDFRAHLMMMIPGVLAIAGLGGWFVSRRALAPVDEITRVARSITAQNLSRRLTVPHTGDELQRMSETWNEVLERLETAVERTRQFTADASHELRTPVALIRSTSELALRRDRSAEEYRDALREIEAEALRMGALTNDLLFLAAADAHSVEMPLEPLDLNRLAAEVVRENLTPAESRGINIRADLLATPGTAPANEAGIRRLVRILTDNAVKFTQPGGSVVVSTHGTGGDLSLSVRDTGPGIPAESIPHIFERFYQGDPSHGEHSGAGLGLSIAQMIAKAHGSEITVESAPGRGSCFSLALKN
jgi:heavy metal sensor kinase